jgi:trimeric autotransporter adhesin
MFRRLPDHLAQHPTSTFGMKHLVFSAKQGLSVALAVLSLGAVLSVVTTSTVRAQNTSYTANAVPILGSANIGIGTGVMTFNATAAVQNAALGYYAMNSNTTGVRNAALGFRALRANTSGNYNTAVGYEALTNNSTATLNTALGYLALTANTTGNNNTASGASALQTNTTGSKNTASGVQALYSNIGGFENTAVGCQAAYFTSSGWGNTALGSFSLYGNTTGRFNSAVGSLALLSTTSGSYNAGIGNQALGTCSTGDYNTGLGTGSGLSAGNQTYSTAVGAFAISNASYKVRLGHTAVTAVEGQVAYTFPSDGRFKTHVRAEDVVGLDFIQKLRPVVYNFETRRFTEFLTQDMPDSLRAAYLAQDFGPSTAVRQSGFIAQEVEQAAKEVGYDFDGVRAPVDAHDNYAVAYSQFVVPLVKAVQEQQAMIEAQADRDRAQQAQIADLQAQVRQLLAQGGADASRSSQPAEVFPNPSEGRFTMRIAPLEQGHWEVFDQHGQQVLRQALTPGQTEYTIDLSGKASGSYLLRLHSPSGILATKQLVVQ